MLRIPKRENPKLLGFGDLEAPIRLVNLPGHSLLRWLTIANLTTNRKIDFSKIAKNWFGKF